MSAIKVEALKAVHTSGTKFYQILRIINTVGKKSFALRHYGKVDLFTGIGKLAVGAIEEDCAVISGVTAGRTKWLEKQRGGYTNGQQSSFWEYDSVDQAMSALGKNVNSKTLSLIRTRMRSPEFQEGLLGGMTPEDNTIAKMRSEPDEPDLVKHPDWGSWG